MGIFAVTLIVCGASLATAGIPDLEESEAAAATTGSLSLFCLPNGTGSAFAEAYVKGASTPTVADATITLTLLDGGGFPVADYPAEDMWLQWVNQTTMFLCGGAAIADFNTDELGVTGWVNPLALGGFSESLVQVMINGDALTSSAGIPLSINSADVNFDGLVNVADVQNFAADYANPVVAYRSDFANDGVLNVADVGKLASGVGQNCN
jgi:hypothetical protein